MRQKYRNTLPFPSVPVLPCLFLRSSKHSVNSGVSPGLRRTWKYSAQFYHQTFSFMCFYLKIQPNNCVPIYFPNEVISCLPSMYQAVGSVSLGSWIPCKRSLKRSPNNLLDCRNHFFFYLPHRTCTYRKCSELLRDRTLMLCNLKGGGEKKETIS